MTRRWTQLVAAVLLLLVIGLSAVFYYRSAWQTAHAAAIAIVMGDDVSPLGPADPSYRVQLGSPARGDITISTDSGWFEFSRTLQFDFTVRNARRPALPPAQFGVGVELTPRARWEVVGYGSGG